MKKRISFVVAAICVLQATVALAAPAAPVTGLEPAMRGLFGLNRWLIANDAAAVKYINDNATQAYSQALRWAQYPLLSSVEVLYPDKACTFQFTAADKPHEVFVVQCVDLSKNTLEGTASTDASYPYEGYDFPVLKMKKFVSNILSTPSAMSQIREAMKGKSRSDVALTLRKVNGEVRWNWEIVDTDKQYGVDVHENATDLKSPVVVDKK